MTLRDFKIAYWYLRQLQNFAERIDRRKCIVPVRPASQCPHFAPASNKLPTNDDRLLAASTPRCRAAISIRKYGSLSPAIVFLGITKYS
jgi:hypothetical protein